MLDYLYEMAIGKKDTLNFQVGLMKNPSVDVSRYWTDFKIPETDHKFTLAAGDGSINKIKYRPFIFYAISVIGLIHKQKQPLKRVSQSEINLIQYQRHVEDHLRNRMGIFEIKNAIHILEDFDVDYFLFDGSILGDIIRPFQKDEESQIENLESIYHLLKRHENIIAISKTSTSNQLFDQDIPDIAVFEEHSQKEGYSTPYSINVGDLKRELPVKNSFFKDMAFTIFYARLEDHKNLLKFEVPHIAGSTDIKHILSVLKSTTVNGYPLLLKMAHNEVVIKKSDIETLAQIVGFMEKRGREMLQ